jgi:hypothetical protein
MLDRHKDCLMHYVNLILLLSLPAFLSAADYELAIDDLKVKYSVPDTWKKLSANAFMYTNDAGRKYSIVINKQPNSKGIDNLKTAYERDFPKALKDFKLIKSEVIKVGDNSVLFIEHTNTMPGAPIRQFFYVIDFGNPTLCVTFSEMDGIGDGMHKEYLDIIKSITKSDK